MSITIRQATPEDVEQVFLLGNHVPEFVTSDHEDTFWPKSVLYESASDSQVMFHVACEADKVIGFIIANCNRPLSKALIENIFVAPESRGNRVGAKLVQSAINQIRSEGYRYISTLVPPGDVPAITMYEAAGLRKGNTFLWLDLPPE